MLVINDAAALEAEANPDLRAILSRYADVLELATIYIVVGPADTVAALAEKRLRPLADWEFIKVNPGGWYEVVVITCDDGAGDVILIPDRAGIDPALLNLCRDNAERVEGSTD
jgi:hypothetical protein